MNSQIEGISAEDPWPGWGVYRGRLGNEESNVPSLPEAPPWRQFPRGSRPTSSTPARPCRDDNRGATYQPDRNAVEMVNAALYLRRPLLITGKPGAGKSTLIYSVARELSLGAVLRWNITSRTTLRDGLYQYDALGRLHDYNMQRSWPIGDYINLGPLATALLPSGLPRALLIDEIDKADIDLPNDLLNVFEEGYFEIPEVAREQEINSAAETDSTTFVCVKSADGEKVFVPSGRVYCTAFPFVVLTSNGERDFPPPFLRRCLRLYLPMPDEKLLARIVDAHLPLDPDNPSSEAWRAERLQMITDFVRRGKSGDLATDQLLNAVFMTIGPNAALDTGVMDNQARQKLIDALLQYLTHDVGPDEVLGKTVAA